MTDPVSTEPEVIYRGGTFGDPVWREVEEHGQKYVALMQRHWWSRRRPAYRRLRVTDESEDSLVFDWEWVPEEHVGALEWRKV